MQINGQQHYLWRAVDQDGHVLDILVQARRDRIAATKFLRTLLKGLTYVPRVVVTDTLAGAGAALRAVLPGVEHRRHQGLNNRAEHAHQPTRERERRMRRCKSPGHAQRFLAASGPIAAHCRPRRHRLTAAAYRLDQNRALRHLAGGHRRPGDGLASDAALTSPRLQAPASRPPQLYLTIPS